MTTEWVLQDSVDVLQEYDGSAALQLCEENPAGVFSREAVQEILRNLMVMPDF